MSAVRVCLAFFCFCYLAHRDLRSFPTRRSSDLAGGHFAAVPVRRAGRIRFPVCSQFIPRHRCCAPSRYGPRSGFQTSSYPFFLNLANAFLKRSEEHTSELQSRGHLVCRLLLEKKKIKI